MLNFDDLIQTEARISNYVKNTPIISNQEINHRFKAEIFFKLDNKQETRSFKARGAFNAVLSFYEKNKKFPSKIVAQSSGNHAQAVALVGKEFNIPVLIYMAKITSSIKVEATRKLGAEVILCEKRSEANFLAKQKEQEGYFFIHPSDNDDVILGQGTCALEALRELNAVDAIFAPCGGGGLLAGSYIAKEGLCKEAKIFGCEPLIANDASLSVQAKKIIGFEDSPQTIADGARTLIVSQRCFNYLQKIDGIIEIPEEKIIFWQKKLTEILMQDIEATSALSIAGLDIYLQKTNFNNKKYLLIISGGNV